MFTLTKISPFFPEITEEGARVGCFLSNTLRALCQSEARALPALPETQARRTQAGEKRDVFPCLRFLSPHKHSVFLCVSEICFVHCWVYLTVVSSPGENENQLPFAAAAAAAAWGSVEPSQALGLAQASL